MNPTGAQLKQLERDNKRYPDHLVTLPRTEWPPMPPFKSGSVAVAAWRSRRFMVVEWREPNGYHRLSVNRTEWDHRQKRFREDIGWDDLQRLKGEAGYGNVAAVECYPPDCAVVNVANMRHLFLLVGIPEYFW